MRQGLEEERVSRTGWRGGRVSTSSLVLLPSMPKLNPSEGLPKHERETTLKNSGSQTSAY